MLTACTLVNKIHKLAVKPQGKKHTLQKFRFFHHDILCIHWSQCVAYNLDLDMTSFNILAVCIRADTDFVWLCGLYYVDTFIHKLQSPVVPNLCVAHLQSFVSIRNSMNGLYVAAEARYQRNVGFVFHCSSSVTGAYEQISSRPAVGFFHFIGK